MQLKGSKTEDNLKAAFAGESQANRRYLYFAAKADVEGYNDVAALFRSTAEGETGHAHGHLEYLETCGDPATGLPFGPTADNLKAAVAGETHEYTDMYPGMAKTARDEGFEEIADWFETLAKAERSHANRFQKALNAGSAAWCEPGGSCAFRCALRPRQGWRARESPHTERAGIMPSIPNTPRTSGHGHSHPRRQSRSAHPPSPGLAQPRFLQRGIPVQGNGTGVRHLPRLPALRQPVPVLPDPVRSGGRISESWKWMASPRPITGRWWTTAICATCAT
jgi:rubrerythrin